MSRPALRSVSLKRPTTMIRSASFLTIAAASAMAAVGYLLPAHRLVYVPSTGGWFDLGQRGETAFHSLLKDGGAWPLVALIVVAVAALLLRRRGIGAGVLAGALAVGGVIVALMPLILVHLLSPYESAIGDDLFGLGLLVTFFGGVALFIGEPVMYVLEQRRMERAARPTPLPQATVLAGLS